MLQKMRAYRRLQQRDAQGKTHSERKSRLVQLRLRNAELQNAQSTDYIQLNIEKVTYFHGSLLASSSLTACLYRHFLLEHQLRL